MEYELHYRLLQQLRLRGMNAIFGLRFRITIGEYFIATIATGTGVFASSLPSPPLAKVPHVRTPSSSVNDRLFRVRLQKQLKDYIHKSHCLFGLDGQEGDKKETTVFQDPCDRRELCYEEQHIPLDSSMQTQMLYEFADAEHTVNGSECPEEQDPGTVYLETREPEAEDLATFLRDPLQPSGLLLTTTDVLPRNMEQTSFNEAVFSWVRGSEVCTSDNLAAQFCTLLGDDWIPVQSFTRIHEEKLTSSDSLIENNGIVPVTIRDANIEAASPFAAFSQSSTVNPLAANPPSSSAGLIASKQGVATNLLSSSFSSATNIWPPNTNRNRSEQSLGPANLGRSLSDILIDSNQLTWFRFRHLMPCVLSALDFRLTITDDDFLQVVTTGMVLVPAHRASHTCVTCPCDTKKSVTGGTLGSATNNEATIGSKNLQTLHVSVIPNRPNHQQPCKHPELSKSSNPTREHPSPPPDLNDPLNGCLLTPLSSLPNTMVETYLGNLDFFFIRETNDLREAGGICGFLHTSLAEVQAVVGAHTTSLGGNALLSYHLSEVLVLRPASRNQAQCLLNVCGDMARIAQSKSYKAAAS
ncbi:C2 domain-containing protein 5 [Clonorchis sinensis]|uniref:C2 domain-containing protein 5 n=1 Tax=Clonorchis sinensis TaxID=79923 RepID=A0A8T1MNK7_CLOSI|nr:C2 domain-containing protein 5 [Clonorchis sinensis]